MELEGARHEGIVIFSASSEKLLLNWSDGGLAAFRAETVYQAETLDMGDPAGDKLVISWLMMIHGEDPGVNDAQ